MNKIVTTLTALFAVSTGANASIIQTVNFNSPGGAAQSSAPLTSPSSSPPANVVPNDQNQGGNCQGNVNPTLDNDVTPSNGSPGALGS